MSSQFSYELDERQIKILMQSGEVDYNETAWQRFESNINKEVATSSVTGFSPKLNFGISRSIIVPILFVGLIGGLSVLLFSFVDFKKKEEVTTEIPLKATLPEVKKPVETPKQLISAKPAPVKTVKDSIPVSTPTVETAAKEPVTVTDIKKPETQSAVGNENVTTAKVASTVKMGLREPQSPVKQKVVPHKKKKRRKMSSEELPSITTPVNLSNSSDEPELDLK